MSGIRRYPTATLFGQLFALIVLSLVGALTINLLVILNLPPPPPDFYRLSEIAWVAKAGPGAVTNDRRPLVARLTNHAPASGWTPPAQFTPSPTFVAPARRAFAAMVGADPRDVVISSDLNILSDRRQFLLVRDELVKNGEPSEERFLIAPFEVGVHRADGRWLIIEPRPSLAPSSWQLRLIVSFMLSALALAPVAYLFARRLAKPIALFAQAAERLGRDPRAPPLSVRGSSEIGIAARAFNDMQLRLARYVENRTAMVGAIAHDLRTPLTRLRFRVETAPEELRVKMAADIAEMETMISATLAFVLDSTRPAERTRLELCSLLESLSDERSEIGLDVAVEHAEKVIIEGDPVGLKRLFNNLLDNAVKFGRLARIRVFAKDGQAVVEIDDRGGGLPDKELERVFEPFYRNDSSRSRGTGGIGLGLAVTRSVARAHGGDAVLYNRIGGGLTARVTLPLEMSTQNA